MSTTARVHFSRSSSKSRSKSRSKSHSKSRSRLGINRSIRKALNIFSRSVTSKKNRSIKPLTNEEEKILDEMLREDNKKKHDKEDAEFRKMREENLMNKTAEISGRSHEGAIIQANLTLDAEELARKLARQLARKNNGGKRKTRRIIRRQF